METPDEPCIQYYFQWLNSNCEYSIADQNSESRYAFIPVNRIRAYFEENNNARLNNILTAIFEPQTPPISSDDVLGGYIAVFCALLELGKGRFIHHFVRSPGLSDSRLPFAAAGLPSMFPISHDDPQFFEKFCKAQWKFCAPVLKYPLPGEAFEENRILPIISKTAIASGNTGTVYKITILDSLNKLDPGKKLSSVPSSSLAANTFALKTFTDEHAEDYYRNETSILSAIMGVTPMALYNIILEYADKGTLETYFENEVPPTKGEDIINFWGGIFMIFKALSAIHGLEMTNKTQSFQQLSLDVTPTDILAITGKSNSVYQCDFKLADTTFNLMRNVKRDQDEDLSNEKSRVGSYDPPEYYRDLLQQGIQNQQLQSAVWSFGCVLSEAATWVATGYSGLQNFRKQRISETEEVLGLEHIALFHDGKRTLKCVSNWHRNLVAILGVSDVITGQVRDLIRGMLQMGGQCPSLLELWARSQQILQDARLKIFKLQGPKEVRNSLPHNLSVHQAVLPTFLAAEAIKWRADRKNGKLYELEGSWLFHRLKDRDHIFLIDDCASMATHWEETTALFGVLAYLVKTSDRDGIELFFSVSSNSFLSKNSSSLVDVVRKHKAQGNSKIATQIASILEKYRSKLTQNEKKRILFPRKVQPLNLYILTDGLWGLDFDPSSVIRNFVDLLAKLKLDRNQVGIQFISFGDDPIGLERLEQLDDSLGAQVDIIDTTPSNGNVWKMLLGAIDTEFDVSSNAPQFHGQFSEGPNFGQSSQTIGFKSFSQNSLDFDTSSLKSVDPFNDSGVSGLGSSNESVLSDSGSAGIFEAAVKQVLRILLADDALQSMFIQAAQRFEKERYIRNTRRLFTQYHRELRKAAIDSRQKDAARMLGEHATWIAEWLHNAIIPGENSTSQSLTAHLSQEADKACLLERFLESNALETFKGVQNFQNVESDDDISIESYGGDIDYSEFPNLEHIKGFLIDGLPFTHLKANLRDFIQPLRRSNALKAPFDADASELVAQAESLEAIPAFNRDKWAAILDTALDTRIPHDHRIANVDYARQRVNREDKPLATYYHQVTHGIQHQSSVQDEDLNSDESDFTSVDSSLGEDPQSTFARNRNRFLRTQSTGLSGCKEKQVEPQIRLDHPRAYFNRLCDIKVETYQRSLLAALRQSSSKMNSPNSPLFVLNLDDDIVTALGIKEDPDAKEILIHYTRLDSEQSDLFSPNSPPISLKVLFSLLECRNALYIVSANFLQLQRSTFIRSSITILVADSQRGNVANFTSIQVAEVFKFNRIFGSAVFQIFRAGSKDVNNGMDISQVVHRACASLTDHCVAYLKTLGFTGLQGNDAVDTWYLLVCILDLAVLVYASAHTEDFDMIQSGLTESAELDLKIESENTERTPSLLKQNVENLSDEHLGSHMDSIAAGTDSIFAPTGLTGSASQESGTFGSSGMPEFSLPGNMTLRTSARIGLRRFSTSCMDGFLNRQKVWVFYEENLTPDSPLYLSTNIEQLADIWGPVWSISDQLSDSLIRYYDAGSGSIVPWPYDSEIHPELRKDERLCHWIPKESLWEITPQDLPAGVEPAERKGKTYIPQLPCFSQNTRLLIGARRRHQQMAWYKCNCNITAVEEMLYGMRRLQQLRTNKAYDYVDSRTIAAVAGGHGVTVGGNLSFKRMKGTSFKEVFVNFWEKEPELRDPRDLTNLWGVAISLCTMNAERISVLELLNTPSMGRYLKRWDWKNAGCKGDFLAVLETGDPEEFCSLWEQNPDWHEELGKVLLSCFQALSHTGFDPERQEFAAFWVSPGTTLPKRVLLKPSEHSWIKFLHDSEVSFTVAVMVEDCLGAKFGRRRCGSLEGGSALRTSICINYNIDPSEKLVRRKLPATPPQKWDFSWDVSGLDRGACFRIGHGRLKTIQVLTRSCLLLEWDLVLREALRKLMGIKSHERDSHWEYTELVDIHVRPIPVYLLSSCD